MAWRIEESLVQGEIDNRQKGLVTGKLWLDGLPEPVVLSLEGNACADLAGCLLKFRNRTPTVPMRKDAVFAQEQRGSIGDLTASRKVRAFDIPSRAAQAMIEHGEKLPEHVANCLYLEWFSQSNGRVVIESTEFELDISPPEWHLTPEEDQQRLADVRAGWSEFVGKLDAAVEHHERGAKDPEEDWDEHDYERFLRASDARTDKYMELLDKYGDSADAEQKIAQEMGWARELTQEEAEEEERHIDEINAACQAALNEPPPEPDPHREGIDWIRAEHGEVCHPLQHRCFESAMKMSDACDELGLGEANDDAVGRFLFEFQMTSVKLGGALNSIAKGNEPHDPAFTVAYLKRALDHLHKSQAGLEDVVVKKVLPESVVGEARRELFEIREGILRLMEEFRDRK